MDVIILDHHHVGPTLPRATAILHPALDPLHPKPHPAAAGVTFSFLHTLEDGRWDGYEIDLVLATLGTVADVVPLLGNNRQLVREGLAALPYLPDCPLRSLLLRCGGKGGGGAPTAMTSADIGYRVAPRINAAGRMADPTIALRALLDGGPALQELELLNTQRQQTTISCLEHALAGMGEHRDPLLCIASEGYAPGILGLLASKLTERYGRPSLIACIRGEECSASARSPECYNIVEGLSRYKHLLSTFGGHAQAAGCTFPLSALGALQDGLMADIAARTQAEDLLPRLSVHASITPSLVPSLAAMLPSLEPFGKGNPEPLFLLSGITLTGTRQVGSEKQHIQAQIGASKLIGFQLGSLLAHTSAPVDLLCRIGMNAWNGCEEVQLFLQDMRAHAKSAEPVLV
jgi:single-stranded-DNA-specific exonuclease